MTVNDYFETITSGTVESSLSATRHYPLLFNDSLPFVLHWYARLSAVQLSVDFSVF